MNDHHLTLIIIIPFAFSVIIAMLLSYIYQDPFIGKLALFIGTIPYGIVLLFLLPDMDDNNDMPKMPL